MYHGAMPRDGKLHFIGAAGSGVSALAQFHAMGGGEATGSDRGFDRGQSEKLRRQLEALGIRIFPQDGSALDGSQDAAVYSAAVEEDNADMRRARDLGVRLVPRADFLAELAAARRSIAVAGTSGKSTVVAMIFEILEAAGRSPSVITGGALLSLERRGYAGNALRGCSDLLVLEADESDGTLTRYAPWLGVLLNVSKDHKELAQLQELFRVFCGRSERFVVNAGAPGLEGFQDGALSFGIGVGRLSAQSVELGPCGSRFTVDGASFELPLPGRHNVENALAALAACSAVGVAPREAAGALFAYQGVARRFQVLGAARGVEVVDDFAHNPAKVAATLAAAHLRARRVHAVFQFHGFGPTRFLKNEFIAAFSSALAPGDVLWLPEIYYAGGTVTRDISARDIVRAVAASGRDARFFENRSDIPPALAREASPGDLVLVMGARDPSLPGFARDMLRVLGVAAPGR